MYPGAKGIIRLIITVKHRPPSQYHGCWGNVNVAVIGASLRFRMTVSSTSAISSHTLCKMASCAPLHCSTISPRSVSRIRVSVLSNSTATSFLWLASWSLKCFVSDEKLASKRACIALRLGCSVGSGLLLSTRRRFFPLATTLLAGCRLWWRRLLKRTHGQQVEQRSDLQEAARCIEVEVRPWPVPH